MVKVALPFEVKASFRVPRQQADRIVSKFRAGISFPGLLPQALKSSDAGVDRKSAAGPEATVWVIFKPGNENYRIAQGSAEEKMAIDSKPVPDSGRCAFLGDGEDLHD